MQALRTLNEVIALREAIDALNLRSRRPCPFSTCEYVETFITHDEFGLSEAELLFLTVVEEHRLIGYLPLRKHRAYAAMVPYGRVGVLISHDTDRPHVIARPEDEARCASAIYEHLLHREDRWSLLELAWQDAESALLQVPQLEPLRYWSRRSVTMPVSRVAVSWKSMQEYLAGLSSGQRKNLGRWLRKTLAAGRVEMVSSDDPAASGPLLELYLGVERRSWKESALAGIGRDPRRVAFFRALAEARQPMRLGVHLLLLDDLPVSGSVTGSFGGVVHALETCFDQDYEGLGCGHVGALLKFRYAALIGAAELNLNGNYAYNKAHFGGVVTQTSAVQIYRVGSAPWLKAQAGRLKRWLRPPSEKALDFNPERRAHEHHAPVRPAHDEARAWARTTLAELHGRFERLSGAALEAAFSPAREKELA